MSQVSSRGSSKEGLWAYSPVWRTYIPVSFHTPSIQWEKCVLEPHLGINYILKGIQHCPNGIFSTGRRYFCGPESSLTSEQVTMWWVRIPSEFTPQILPLPSVPQEGTLQKFKRSRTRSSTPLRAWPLTRLLPNSGLSHTSCRDTSISSSVQWRGLNK